VDTDGPSREVFNTMNDDGHYIQEANLRQLRLALSQDGLGEALESMDKYYSADFVRHGDKRDYTLKQLREGLAKLYAGFPDLKRIQLDLMADGDRAAYRWEATGTHLGEYMGVRATGQPVITRGIAMVRFEDGLIAEEWVSWNRASLLHDLGIIPLDR
jgi:steroid delta-isomerase-like uncharacterized protein